MARKKKNRKIKKVQTTSNNKSWLNRVITNPVVIIIFFITIITNTANIISSIDTLLSKYKDFWVWFGSSAQFSGKWTNSSEGYIDIIPRIILKNESDFTINVELRVKDHQVTGVINSSAFLDFCNHLEQPENLRVDIKLICNMQSNMLLAGNKSPLKSNFDAEVFNYISGKKLIYATLHFKVSNEELEITNKNIGVYSLFFPNKAFLIKEPEFVD